MTQQNLVPLAVALDREAGRTWRARQGNARHDRNRAKLVQLHDQPVRKRLLDLRAQGRYSRVYTIAEDEMVCTLPPAEAAARTGRPLVSIYQRRILLRRIGVELPHAPRGQCRRGDDGEATPAADPGLCLFALAVGLAFLAAPRSAA